ncbi:MAG: DUF1464 family protein [Desulfurococcales archaeon]|nr:DUF1464 family protein [Desulfurococcales archaeon]
MVRVVGIDPGTASFDIVLLDDGYIVGEKSIPTPDVARDAELVLEAMRELGKVDAIAGPSGYGVPVTWNKEIVDPRKFAVEVLLLSTEEQLARGMAAGEIGVMVYQALAQVVVEFWREKLPVVYIPSVILLPTVPFHRKLGRLDMGTADKMALTLLGIHTYSRDNGVDPRQTNFIVVEMGYGYNAITVVKKGRIVDGLGGTMCCKGFLTQGPIDIEHVILGGEWDRSDVFHGGVATVASIEDPLAVWKEWMKGKEPAYSIVESALEDLSRAVYGMSKLHDIRTILLSGRLSRVNEVRSSVLERLSELNVKPLGLLDGAKISKEAAQGYALVADGLLGGRYSHIVFLNQLAEARGTVVDYAIHPRLVPAKQRIRNAYKSSVRTPKL